MGAILEAHDLTRRLSGEVPVTLVDGVTLQVNRGEFVSVSGPSGSGKSSLLYLLGLLDIPTVGEIAINGRVVSKLPQTELASIRLSQIGFVFQFHFLLPEFSALENVMLPMQRLGRLSPVAIRQRATKLLTDLGLEEHLYKLPKQLSGGQSQRVAIARALANEPQLVLADEPTGNLDSAASKSVENILLELAHQQNRAVVVVTHETRLAQSADRQITLVDGKLA